MQPLFCLLDIDQCPVILFGRQFHRLMVSCYGSFIEDKLAPAAPFRAVDDLIESVVAGYPCLPRQGGRYPAPELL